MPPPCSTHRTNAADTAFVNTQYRLWRHHDAPSIRKTNLHCHTGVGSGSMFPVCPTASGENVVNSRHSAWVAAGRRPRRQCNVSTSASMTGADCSTGDLCEPRKRVVTARPKPRSRPGAVLGQEKRGVLKATVQPGPPALPSRPPPTAGRSSNRPNGRDVGSDRNGRRSENKRGDVVAAQKDFLRRVKVAGSRGQWREILKLLDEMRIGRVPRNLFVYNAAISALGRCRRPWDAEALLDVMLDKENMAPDQISYNSAISAHARCGDLDSARRVLELMRRRLVKPDVITFNTLADAAAKKADPTAAAEVLQVMAEEGVAPDVITYNACLAACGRKGDHRRATALLELMIEDGVDPDQRSYSAVIAAAGRGGKWEETLRLLKEMRRAGLAPDRVTFNTAISAIGTGGDWKAAMALLGEMKAAGVKPDTVSYTAALGACGRAGEWEVSLRLLENMHAAGAGAAPNTRSYSAAMAACGKAGQQEEALHLLDDMLRHGGAIAPDTVAYNSAIDACSVAGDWSTALRLLDEMKRGTGGAAAAPPDVISYGGAITACARAGRAEEALRLVAELRANEALTPKSAVRGGGGAGVRRRTILGSRSANGGGVGVVRRARTSSNAPAAGSGGGGIGYPLPLPNLVTYSAALFACLKAGEVHRGTGLLDEMIAAGIKPNNIHCDTMIAAWSTAGEPNEAMSVMKRLQQHGFEPSPSTFETLVWGFAQVADWESAVRLLASILSKGLQPSTRSWDAAIAACSQAGHWERALGLLADMRRQGVIPSRVTYTAAVAGLNRPHYAEWGPKLEKLARLLQNSADASSRERRLQRRRARFRAEITDETHDSEGHVGAGRASISRDVDRGLLDTVARSGAENGFGNDVRNVLENGPSSEDFDGSIEALGDADHVDGAACLLRVMRQEGFHASPRAYRSVIYACARVGLLSEAVALAKEMACENGGNMAVRATTNVDDDRDGNLQVEDDQEYDLNVVYNCIVCNFARVAATGAFDEVGGDTQQGKDSVRTAHAVFGGDTTSSENEGLVSLLMGVTEGAEGSLNEEAASGGVEVMEEPEFSSLMEAEAVATGSTIPR